MMNNNFDVIKNYGYEDEEIVFNSDDYNICIVKCNELNASAGKYEIYEVYPSDEMLCVAKDLKDYIIFDSQDNDDLNLDDIRKQGYTAVRYKGIIYKVEPHSLGDILGYYL